jgi:hypothetical protein
MRRQRKEGNSKENFDQQPSHSLQKPLSLQQRILKAHPSIEKIKHTKQELRAVGRELRCFKQAVQKEWLPFQ